MGPVLSDLLTDLRDGLEMILGPRLQAVYLYGLHARGEARPDSDIDVLIVVDRDLNHLDLLEQSAPDSYPPTVNSVKNII